MMLRAHMDTVENHLVSISRVPENAGHALHKGTPREAFIREFLDSHLPSNVDIGTGEIIDAESAPRQPRNQFDIVVYRRNYPKLNFGGGISGFLIESVIATIEVKSSLTIQGFSDAARAAHAAKHLSPNFVTSFHSGYIPPKGWVTQVYPRLGIPQNQLPSDEMQRLKTPAESIDAVFVLNKGFMYFDNMPFGFSSAQHRAQNPESTWILADSATGNLLLMFLFIQGATANIEGRWLNALPYLKAFSVPNVQWRA